MKFRAAIQAGHLPCRGEEGGESGALPPLDGEGAERSEAGGVHNIQMQLPYLLWEGR